MRKIGAALIMLTALIFITCEKDDICVDGNSPLLVLRFYDVNDTAKTKTVSSLRIVGLGKDTTVNTIADRSDLDSIRLPLKVEDTTTSFLLISDSAADENGVETGNRDTLTFNYETKEIFISRACGFIVNYDKLGTVLTTDTENWIKNIKILNPTVENSAAAHVKIYH